MEILNAEVHVLELDGFLNALRCLVGHQGKVFGAGLIKKDGMSVDNLIEKSILPIKKLGLSINQSVVGFEYIQNILKVHIYSKLPANTPECIENIDWNLIEYYGLISTAENEDGPWNRLISQDSYVFEYVDENERKSVVFFVDYDEFMIVTYL